MEFSIALDIVNNSELNMPIGAREERRLPREIRPSHPTQRSMAVLEDLVGRAG